MVVTVGLQDISSMYITLETSYIFILYVYHLRSKLTGVCPSNERDDGHHKLSNCENLVKAVKNLLKELQASF